MSPAGTDLPGTPVFVVPLWWQGQEECQGWTACCFLPGRVASLMAHLCSSFACEVRLVASLLWASNCLLVLGFDHFLIPFRL